MLATGWAEWQEIQNEEIKKATKNTETESKVKKPAVKPQTAAEYDAWLRSCGM